MEVKVHISNKNHPERGKDEVFFTNSSEVNFSNIKWETKRMGNKAYNLIGEEISKGRVDSRSEPPVPIPDVFPVFIKVDEVKKLPTGEEMLKILIPSN